MTTIERKFNALAAFVLAENDESRDTARKALEAIMRAVAVPETSPTSDQEDVVHEFLMEIGADPVLCGYKYIVYGLLQTVMHPELTDNITYGFYPLVAAKFDTTPTRAERSIRHVIDRIWECGDIDTLTHYFGVYTSFKNGKPTNGSFIARSALILKKRLANK